MLIIFTFAPAFFVKLEMEIQQSDSNTFFVKFINSPDHFPIDTTNSFSFNSLQSDSLKQLTDSIKHSKPQPQFLLVAN
jgi:hypothetical protein